MRGQCFKDAAWGVLQKGVLWQANSGPLVSICRRHAPSLPFKGIKMSFFPTLDGSFGRS